MSAGLLLHLGDEVLALPDPGWEAALARCQAAPPPLVWFARPGASLPAGYAQWLPPQLAGQTHLAVGLAGAVYPELFEGLAETVWHPGPARVPPEGLPVHELALHGLALSDCPLPLVRRVVELWQDAPSAMQAWLDPLVALELHRAGWRCRLLPGGGPAAGRAGRMPAEAVRAVLKLGGMGRLFGGAAG